MGALPCPSSSAHQHPRSPESVPFTAARPRASKPPPVHPLPAKTTARPCPMPPLPSLSLRSISSGFSLSHISHSLRNPTPWMAEPLAELLKSCRCLESPTAGVLSATMTAACLVPASLMCSRAVSPCSFVASSASWPPLLRPPAFAVERRLRLDPSSPFASPSSTRPSPSPLPASRAVGRRSLAGRPSPAPLLRLAACGAASQRPATASDDSASPDLAKAQLLQAGLPGLLPTELALAQLDVLLLDSFRFRCDHEDSFNYARSSSSWIQSSS